MTNYTSDSDKMKAPNSTKDGSRQSGNFAATREAMSDMPAAISSEIKEHLDDLGAETQKQASRMMSAATTQVRSHPGTTLGIAAGAGFILGMLFFGRR